MTKSLIDKLKGGFRSVRRNFKNILLSVTAGLFLYGAQCVPNPPPKPKPEPGNNPPEIISNPVTEFYKEQGYRYRVEAIDADGNALTFFLIKSPEWLKIYPDPDDELNAALIVDIPEKVVADETPESVIVGVSDGEDSDTQEYTLRVLSMYDGATVNLSEVGSRLKNINEETEESILLPDKDSKGNSVYYISTTPNPINFFEKFNLNDNLLTLKGDKDKIGNYIVTLEFEHSGKISTATLEGIINNLLDISGKLEDNENDGKDAYGNPLHTPGVIRIYNSLQSRLDLDPKNIIIYNPNNYSTSEGIITDSNGEFNFQINSRVSQAILQAKLDIGSYVRTVRLNGSENYDLTGQIKVVPYVGVYSIDFDNDGTISDEEKRKFRAHVAEVLTYDDNSDLNNDGKIDFLDALLSNPEIKRWYFGDSVGIDEKFRELIIIKNNPNGNGFFEDNEIINIQQRISNPNDIGSFFEGKIEESQIKVENNWKDEFNYDYLGRIFLIPDANPKDFWGNSVEGYTSIKDDNYNGYVDVAKIIIKVNSSGYIVSDGGFAHEGGHSSGQEGHAQTLATLESDGKYYANEKTIMAEVANPSYNSPGFADKKTSKIVNKPTYTKKKLDDIMALDFLDEP